MSISGSTSRHCYALGCANGDYRLQKWRQTICELHGSLKESCGCPPPFELFTFPTQKRNPEGRLRWLKALSRAASDYSHKYLEPKKDHRVCSVHFVDGRPTKTNPDPALKLGHALKRQHDKDSGREERYMKRVYKATENICQETVTEGPSFEDKTEDASLPFDSSATFIGCKFVVHILMSLLRKYRNNYQMLKRENYVLKHQLKLLKQQKQKQKPVVPSLSSTLLKKDSDCLFYTGIENLPLFTKLHNFVEPFVRRRWRGLKCVSVRIRRFISSPKKFGPARKLKSQDEFLLTLMLLRLGLLKKDLADRFGISVSLCSQIFNSWLTAMDKVLSHLVFWPSKEQVIAAKPKRYKHLPDLRAIIDCSEIFIETPKDPRLQAATWSDYKHHNTGKFLVAVAPNSATTYCSSIYNGGASDKAITAASGFLDKLEPYDMVQADKGFNIQDECAARLVQLHIPPGKRGKVQMSVAANIKTSRIANLRILVEQVIRRIKSFRIIKYTVPISVVPTLDKVLKVCCALCNLKKPIYKE